MSLRLFILLVLLLVGGAIVRSAIATRLDGFTIDEAYHISAGVSYVRYADFRINPEHPPLVKLWVGSLISATGFHLTRSAHSLTRPTNAISRSKTCISAMISIPCNDVHGLRCGC